MKKVILVSILLTAPFKILIAQHEFQWLVGTWKLKDKAVYEVWKRTNEKQLIGKSFRVSGKDTIIMERLNLTYFDNGFHYMPDVPENKHPVDFKIISYDQDSFIAENLQHDFPKTIRYTIVRKDEEEYIHASIEGNGKGIHYAFVKLK